MYLPKSKYTVSMTPPGQYTLNGEDYVGPVLTDYKGNTYAGSEPNNLRGTLVKVVYESPSASIVPAKIVPTDADYSNGSMMRYFRQNNRTKKVDEIASGSFTDTHYTYVSASWILTGSLDDREFKIDGRVKPLVIRGVRYKNEQTIQELDKAIPGISGSGVLNNPEEFVVSLKKS